MMTACAAAYWATCDFTRNYSNTYARARIVYDLSHRVDGPLLACMQYIGYKCEFNDYLTFFLKCTVHWLY